MHNLTYDASRLIDWCSRQKSLLERQIDMLVKGEMHTGQRTSIKEDFEDTSAESLADARAKLADLNRLLEGAYSRGFQNQVGVDPRPR
jgi:hypothetical protein